MTKESHLAHIIIASSDGYFLNTVYNDSKLKKSSKFYKVDYLPKYIQFDKNKKKALKVVNEKGTAGYEDFENLPIEAAELKEILRDMVTNNILYLDPTEAAYYPQGKSYQCGIRLYFGG